MQTTLESSRPLLARRQPQLRPPQRQDYLAFFIGAPVLLAFVFSLVEIRLINGLPYLVGLLYTLLHMFLAWWLVSLGAWTMQVACRSWKPPVIFVCVLGFAVSLVPAAVLYRLLGDFFGALYPVFAANRTNSIAPAWSLEYILHFARYSLPAIVLFVATVKTYRYITGVEWFGYSRAPVADARPDNPLSEVPPDSPARVKPLVDDIEGSRLPAGAELFALKADQHYVHIWSSEGTDMVRGRFGDLLERLNGSEGGQVHRSWWVNFSRVNSVNHKGPRFELQVEGGMTVPVSVAYRNQVREQLETRGHIIEQS